MVMALRSTSVLLVAPVRETRLSSLTIVFWSNLKLVADMDFFFFKATRTKPLPDHQPGNHTGCHTYGYVPDHPPPKHRGS